MKKRIGKILIKLMNPLILWCFGWKCQQITYRCRGFPIRTVTLYTDPKNKYVKVDMDVAIRVCEGRIDKLLRNAEG